MEDAPRGFFEHAENLRRLHVQHLRDPPLHDEKVRVVHVELHGVKQVLNPRRLRDVPVDEVLVPPADDDLPRDDDLNDRRGSRVGGVGRRQSALKGAEGGD
eukprot:31446-Pelagococcus_subviridis.AAC.5